MIGVRFPPASILQTRRGPVAAIMEGEGPVLLAVHGAMGGADQSWLLARALLGEVGGHRIVAVARPGYPGAPLSAGETPEAQADLHAAVLDALGERDAVIAAVSAGGPSSLQFAVRHPDRCRGLILASACTGPLETPAAVLSRMRAMRLMAWLPGFVELARRRLARDPDAPLRRAISDPDILARTLADPEAATLLRALGASVLDRLRDRLPGTANDIRRYATIERPAPGSITAPVLALHGAADAVVPFQHAAAIAESMPRARLTTLEGGEHVALFTHLQEVRAEVAAFLRRLDATGDA